MGSIGDRSREPRRPEADPVARRATIEPILCYYCGAEVDQVARIGRVGLSDPPDEDGVRLPHRCPDGTREHWWARSVVERTRRRVASLARRIKSARTGASGGPYDDPSPPED